MSISTFYIGLKKIKVHGLVCSDEDMKYGGVEVPASMRGRRLGTTRENAWGTT